ncbi:MAG: hypothetical protein KDK10_16670 [Maritimibacter sp.]|nr:hypothetical protein [Maritimibacter sp.]
MGIALIFIGAGIGAILMGLAVRAGGRAGTALRQGAIRLPAALRAVARPALVWPLPVAAAISLVVALVLALDTSAAARLGLWLYGIALCGTLPMALTGLVLGVWQADRAVRAGQDG